MNGPSARRREQIPARVLMISTRRSYPHVSRCLRFEFEDVVCSVDGASLLAPHTGPRPALLRRLAAKVDARTAWLWGAARPRRRAERPYELVFVGCSDLSDLTAVRPPPWRGAGRISACCIDDLYAARDRRRSGELALLREFDHVFTGCEGSTEEFSAILGKPCRYLPFSVDTLAFCPFPESPERIIDVYAMGRRPAETHGALRALAARRGWFYLYDTSRDADVTSHVEHRERLAELIGRSRYFLVNPGKMTSSEINGQEEIGYRYFEGAAAGAIMIGERPRTPAFGRLFDWPDAVVHLPFNSAEVGAVIEPLERDPARAERIRRTNVAQSLRRHDHVHRWCEVLSVAGLAPTRAMEARMRLLERRAREVESGLVAEPAPLRRAPERAPGAGAQRAPERFSGRAARHGREAAEARGALWRTAQPPESRPGAEADRAGA